MLSQLSTLFSRMKSPKQSQIPSLKSSESSASLPPQSPESSSNFLTQITKQIKSDEGLVLHAYDDSLGYLTIGYGRLIDHRKGGGITKEEAEYLLANDIERKLQELQERLPWIKKLDDVRKGVLLNMSFQLGVSGLMAFKNTLAKIEQGDYEGAAVNMLQSKWATQTPNRAQRMAEQMRSGKWQ